MARTSNPLGRGNAVSASQNFRLPKQQLFSPLANTIAVSILAAYVLQILASRQKQGGSRDEKSGEHCQFMSAQAWLIETAMPKHKADTCPGHVMQDGQPRCRTLKSGCSAGKRCTPPARFIAEKLASTAKVSIRSSGCISARLVPAEDRNSQQCLRSHPPCARKLSYTQTIVLARFFCARFFIFSVQVCLCE